MVVPLAIVACALHSTWKEQFDDRDNASLLSFARPLPGGRRRVVPRPTVRRPATSTLTGRACHHCQCQRGRPARWNRDLLQRSAQIGIQEYREMGNVRLTPALWKTCQYDARTGLRLLAGEPFTMATDGRQAYI